MFYLRFETRITNREGSGGKNVGTGAEPDEVGNSMFNSDVSKITE